MIGRLNGLFALTHSKNLALNWAGAPEAVLLLWRRGNPSSVSRVEPGCLSRPALPLATILTDLSRVPFPGGKEGWGGD